MKNIKTILVLALVSLLCMIGRGENSNKQKELELKESELKEKEISLKEKDTTNLKAVVQETLKNETAQETKKMPSDTKVLTMTFEEFSEGDFPHLIFKDISTGEDYDFMFLSDNNLNGIAILLEDANAAFGLKANPNYLKKSFIVETKKKLVEQYDLEGGGGTDKTKAWVITSIKLK